MLHWKAALNVFRELEDINFSLADYKTLRVGQAVVPYKKHEDRSVVEAANELLKKYRALYHAEIEERKQEEDDLF